MSRASPSRPELPPEARPLDEAEARAIGRLPAPLRLADWRRRVSALYTTVRDPRIEPAARHAAWVAAREALVRRHPESPLPPPARAVLDRLPVAPYDPAWRLAAEAEEVPDGEADAIEIVLSVDGRMRLEPALRLAFRAPCDPPEAPPRRLTAYRMGGYGSHLFLPFADATSGRDPFADPAASYGGGRYLIDGAKGADPGLGEGGRVALDLNFAYPPSCAYHPAWDCPLAPPANRLPFAVPVGERVLPPPSRAEGPGRGSP